mgnify:CR=1 FL=1
MHGFSLTVVNCPTKEDALTNFVFVSQTEYDKMFKGVTAGEKGFHYVALAESIFVCRPHANVAPSCLALNGIQRSGCNFSTNAVVNVRVLSNVAAQFPMATLNVEVDYLQKGAKGATLDSASLERHLQKTYLYHVFSSGQQLAINFLGTNYKCTVVDLTTSEAAAFLKSSDVNEDAAVVIDPDTSAEAPGNGNGNGNGTDDNLIASPFQGLVSGDTQIYFSKARNSNLQLSSYHKATVNTQLFRGEFNFEKMGIGGLDKQFAEIFRRAFASRVFPASVVHKLGISHVKGMLLYGPPGTGKTLIARQIAKMLNGKEPKLVHGPEILNKYVGQSEENVRALFAEAEAEMKERGDDSDLHVIIMDEMDAICRSRGSRSDGTGVGDSVVNQLLSKIDGVHQLNNILLIGMTNRKDMIDDALLRPGRLEVHIEIGLPDTKGRLQILKIHTQSMREAGYLATDVSLDQLAVKARNYSGAEIEGLVKAASSYALNRNLDVSDLTKAADVDNVCVTSSDFEMALSEVKPAFGLDEDDLAVHMPGGIIPYGQAYSNLIDSITRFTRQVQLSSKTASLTLLMEGPVGSGKTALACHVALQSKFPFTKFFTCENYVGDGEIHKINKLRATFDDAYKSPLSLIILDDLERIIEYVSLGGAASVNNRVLQALMVLIKKAPPPGHKLLVIATTSKVSVMMDVGLRETFNAVLFVPTLREPQQMLDVLREVPGLKDESLKGLEQHLPPEMPIKKLLLIAEMAREGTAAIGRDALLEGLNDYGFGQNFI